MTEKSKNLLILDDNEDELRLISAILKSRCPSCNIFTCNDPQTVQGQVSKINPDIVVMDIRMPKVDGFTVCKDIRNITGPRTFIVLQTGSIEAIEIGKAEEAGADAFCVKTHDCSDLIKTIQSSVQGRGRIEPISEESISIKIAHRSDDVDHLKEELVKLDRYFRLTKEAFRKLYNSSELEKTELTQINQIRSDFFSMISHEIRTPLASIKASIDVILKGAAGEVTKDQRTLLEGAIDGINRLVRLINSVLDFSKLEAKEISLELELFDVNTLLMKFVETAKIAVSDKGLYVRKNLRENLPLILCDVDRIEQVLTNLINNAIKFTKEGGITLVSEMIQEDHQDYIKVSVLDTGPGIPVSDRELVFNRYYQSKGFPENKKNGTGLGLNICKEIISLHKGRIWVEEISGPGNKITFILPVRRGENA